MTSKGMWDDLSESFKASIKEVAPPAQDISEARPSAGPPSTPSPRGPQQQPSNLLEALDRRLKHWLLRALGVPVPRNPAPEAPAARAKSPATPPRSGRDG